MKYPQQNTFVRSPETPLVISPADMSSCWRRWFGTGCRNRSRCIYRSDCCCHFGLSLHFRWPGCKKENKMQKNECNVLWWPVNLDTADGAAVLYHLNSICAQTVAPVVPEYHNSSVRGQSRVRSCLCSKYDINASKLSTAQSLVTASLVLVSSLQTRTFHTASYNLK